MGEAGTPERQTPNGLPLRGRIFAAFDDALRLLHPFMPFLTEELWHQLPQPAGAKSIALGTFPKPRPHWGEDGKDVGMMEHFHFLQEIIVSIRNIRAEMKLDPKKRVAAEIFVWDELTRGTIERNLDGVVRLGLLSQLTISSEPLEQTGGSRAGVDGAA